MNSNKTTLFYGAIVVTIVAIAIAIYYAIPGINHILVSDNPMSFHVKHVIAFSILAIIGILAALVNRPRSVAKNGL